MGVSQNQVGSRLDDGRPVEETSKLGSLAWKMSLDCIALASRYKKVIELKEKGKKHPELMSEAHSLLGSACQRSFEALDTF